MTALATTDEDWTRPCVTAPRATLCVGLPIALDGYFRELELHECSWLHAALTGALGRNHQRPSAHTRSDWTLVPWRSQSGWAAAWWSEADALALATTSRHSRIGARDVQLRFGAPIRVHAPPTYATGVHLARVTLRTPLVVSSTNSDGQKVSKRRADDAAMTNATWTLARKMELFPGTLTLRVLDARTEYVPIYYRGKVGRVDGLVGTVDVACDATSRYVLEAASRGLGLGSRVAYGCGRVEVTTLAR